jgi:hypothetical protein
MTKPKENETYPAEESRRRFEAALRGARIAGHKPMTEVTEKRGPSKIKSRKKRAKETG